MSRILVVATAGAGGNQRSRSSRRRWPCVTPAHETLFLGDRSVQRVVRDVGVDTETLAPELDLGPRLAGAIREAMGATEGDLVAAGRIVQERMAA